MDTEIKVSVCVVTYNQEKYITECLQSLVDQKTNFKFEIIVSDDCSKDNTRAIISDFYNKYPDIIRPIYREVNLGGSENYLQTHACATGEYIAHMDGDDYALAEKLQTQADFLDKNPECNMVFHQMDYIEKDEYVKIGKLSKRVRNYNFYRKDIIRCVAIGANSSKMYRAELRKIELPDFEMVDYTVNVIQVGEGYAAYCGDNALGVYRRAIGISGSESVNHAVVNTLQYFLDNYPEYKRQIHASSLMWFLNNIKYRKKTKWLFLNLILKAFSVFGFFEYFANRGFQKELSGL